MNSETVTKTPYGSNISKTNNFMPKHVLSEERDSYARLKLKINALLWEELPANTTIGQAEDIACNFFIAIKDEMDKKDDTPNP